MRIPNGHCERARAWASLDVDGELSEIERAFLRSHLVRCAECTEYVGRLQAMEEVLRSAPLERLSAPVEIRSVRSGRRTRAFMAAASTAVAATAAVAALSAIVFRGTSEIGPGSRSQPVVGASSQGTVPTMRDLRRGRLVAAGRPRVGHFLAP